MAKEKINADEGLITRHEAIALLRVSSPTFWRFTEAGKFPVYRAGKKMLFKRSEILAAIKKPATHE